MKTIGSNKEKKRNEHAQRMIAEQKERSQKE